jgi:SAM-dependent methyltransferase
MKKTKCLRAALAVVFLSASAALAQITPTAPPPNLDVPYVPTSYEVVDAMLKMANVKKGDVVYDLGCGDGRIVIAAARDYGATGVGVDLDPQRIREANENARTAGVADRVKFIEGDLFKTNFSRATVLTLYLYPEINMKLRPKILRLKPGTRVVSHAFDMGDWKPEKSVRVGTSMVYFWTVPKRTAAPKKSASNGKSGAPKKKR